MNLENKGGLILIVDDDENTCIELKKILNKKGYEVSIAHSGEKAITLAQENNYNILLVDMNLPTLNGLETYLSIRQINPKIIAIIITGYYNEMKELIDIAMDNSTYTCLQKPLNIQLLLDIIKKITEKSRG